MQYPPDEEPPRSFIPQKWGRQTYVFHFESWKVKGCSLRIECAKPTSTFTGSDLERGGSATESGVRQRAATSNKPVLPSDYTGECVYYRQYHALFRRVRPCARGAVP